MSLKTVCLAIVLFFPLFINSAYADITTGLVGWWKFDEATSGTCSGAVIIDSSGQGNTGTCSGSPTYGAGRRGDALSFNSASSQHVSYGTNVSTFQFNMSSFTIAAWVFPTTNTGTPAIWGSSAGANGSRFAMTFYINHIDMFLKDTSGNAGDFGNVTISTNTWTHVTNVVDRTANKVFIYINGILQATISIASITGNIASQGTVETAQIVSGSAPTFNGSIDDIRIYNRALSASDVAQLYDPANVVLHNAHLRNFHIGQ